MEKRIKEIKLKLRKGLEKFLRLVDLCYKNDELMGFAFCVDDQITTVFPSFITRSWLQGNKDYEDLLYVYTDWEQDVDALVPEFDLAMELLNSLGEELSVEQRFNVFTGLLRECRESGLIRDSVLLCCGSTDPSDYLMSLTVESVVELNHSSISAAFCEALE